MGDKTKLSISPIFFNLMASLTTTAMGQTWYFVRENGKIASRKCDEDKGIIIMNMELDDFAFSFEENEITFHNFKEFLGALKIQDFPKSQPALTRQVYRGTDSVLIKNGKSNIYHRLSGKDRYASRYGFDQYADISAMVADDDLPKMLCFDLSKDTIQAIYEKASKFKSVACYQLEDRVRLLQSNLFAGVARQRYDLIISNPPYVNAASMATLPQEYRHEPEMALGSGEDGLDLVRLMLKEAHDHLNPGGLLVVEIGHNRDTLEAAFPTTPFTWLETAAGNEYVFMLRREELP